MTRSTPLFLQQWLNQHFVDDVGSNKDEQDGKEWNIHIKKITYPQDKCEKAQDNCEFARLYAAEIADTVES